MGGARWAEHQGEVAGGTPLLAWFLAPIERGITLEFHQCCPCRQEAGHLGGFHQQRLQGRELAVENFLKLFSALAQLLALGCGGGGIGEFGGDFGDLIGELLRGAWSPPQLGLPLFDLQQQAVAVQPGEEGKIGSAA